MLSAEHAEMMEKSVRGSVGLFFRSMLTTLVCIACAFILYSGCCRAYEGIRQVCFDDHRAAVVLCRDYIKLFDLIFYF